MDTVVNNGELLYGFLPWWACCTIGGKVGKLPWCTKAVLSIIMARLVGLKAAIENEDGHGLDADDVASSIDNMGGDDHFRFSLSRLTKYTGLTRESVIAAKRTLNHRFGIVKWYGNHGREQGSATETDLLVPDWNFRVVVKPASEGFSYVSFIKNGGGSENGL